MKRLIVLAALAVLCAGCSLINQHGKEMDQLNSLASKASDSLKAQGTAQYAAGAHGINPGVRVGAGLEYFAYARYEGLAGQFTASAAGKMEGLTADQEAAAKLIATSQYLSDAQKSQLLADIAKTLVIRVTAPASQPTEHYP